MERIASWFAALNRYFIPQRLVDEGGSEYQRAKLLLQAVFALYAWGPIFAVVFWFWFGSPISAVIMLGGTAGVTAALVLMKKFGNQQLAGNFMVGWLLLTMIAISAVNGGLAAPSLAWVVLIPMFGVLFAGNKAGAGWLVSVVVTVAGFAAIEFSALDFPQLLAADEVQVLRTIGLAGLVVVGFAVLLVQDRLQQWLNANLRHKEKQTRAILETAPDGVLVIGKEGEIRRANPGAGLVFETEVDKMEGRLLSNYIPALRSESHDSFDTAELDGEYEALTHDERSFPAAVSIRKEGSERTRAVVVVRDITEQKQRERELRQARDQALEANRAKSTFLANMSHELRTPLNAVIGYSEMMIEDVEATADDETAELRADELVTDLDRIRTSGDQLLSLVDDVINLSKIEAGKVDINYGETDVEELVDRVATTVRPMAQHNDNELVVDVDGQPGTIETDGDKVRQILLNLTNNACKFTREGTVRLEAHRSGDRVVFRVSDTGIGMTDEELTRVFEAFSQADASTTRQFDGSGLGLTLIDHFTELLGGELDVESEVGEGTTFSVEIPDESTTSKWGTEPEAETDQSGVKEASATGEQ